MTTKKNKELNDKLAELYGLIAKRIKNVRLQNNLSQKQFADVIGVTNKYVQKIERTECHCSLKIILAICQQFGMSLSDFFNFDIDFKSNNSLQYLVHLKDNIEYVNLILEASQKLLEQEFLSNIHQKE